MSKKKLSKFFEEYIDKGSIFVNKKHIQAGYTPENIPHRDEQIDELASMLAPVLKMDKPSNIFIYGRTGTGKTCVTNHVIEQLMDTANEKKLKVNSYYLNCKLKKVADTEYRLIAQLARGFGAEVPATGLPTDEIYKIFVRVIDDKKQILILILDEIDQLVKKAGDGILYNLTRLNSELKNCELVIVGISNDLMFTDNMDPRVKSSLSEEELLFPPYNAMQLQDILKERSKGAFIEEAIGEGVIEKCAAYAAREHGDARRALELLRVAGELTEREGKTKITEEYIDRAEDKIENDRVIDNVKTQPKQVQISLFSILNVMEKHKPLFTGDVYDFYKDVCIKVGMSSLTQRRVSDIIAELDMLGIINARVISKGRYGRTREIVMAVPPSTCSRMTEILKQSLHL